MRVQREKIRSGQKKDKNLKGNVGRKCYISRGARLARLSSGGIQAGGPQGGSHRAGRCGISRRSRDAAWRAAPRVRAAKNS